MRKINHNSACYDLTLTASYTDDGMGTRFVPPQLGLASEHHIHYTSRRETYQAV